MSRRSATLKALLGQQLRGRQTSSPRIAKSRRHRSHALRASLTALLLVSSAVTAVGGPTHADEAATTELTYGYVPVPYGPAADIVVGGGALDDGADGVAHLHYGLVKHADNLPRPVVVEYQGYTNHPWISTFGDRLVKAGYNFLMVAARGVQCSEGVYQPLSETEALDGAAVVEWAARQPWSNGQVALTGWSYSGFTQFRVAAKRPQGLVAMVPLNPMTDLYRDAVYPGGILNAGLLAAFTGVQHYTQVAGIVLAGAQNFGSNEDRERCSRHLAQRASAAENQLGVTAPQHQYLDEFHATRSPIEYVDEIAVPLFTTITWQDPVLGSRAAEFLGRLNVDYHAIFTNGDHDVPAAVFPEVVQFLNHHVKGAEYDAPRVRVWWDRTSNLDTDTGTPTWETAFATWPPPQATARVLPLTAGGMNLDGTPGVGASDTYAYVPGSGQVPIAANWQVTPTPGSNLEYTSPPLERDLVVAGPGSVDLWMTSTAANTDVQVVLSEVRDGKETFVKAGWLRASHRALDPKSTPLQPVHPHDEATVTATPPLSATTPTQLRVELPAFAHSFRAGSRIRLWIEAPNAQPYFFGFASWPVPAQNAVHHAGAAQSALVLAEIPGATAQAPAPACGSLRSQPCRTALR